jgi:hypothetical protein
VQVVVTLTATADCNVITARALQREMLNTHLDDGIAVGPWGTSAWRCGGHWCGGVTAQEHEKKQKQNHEVLR